MSSSSFSSCLTSISGFTSSSLPVGTVYPIRLVQFSYHITHLHRGLTGFKKGIHRISNPFHIRGRPDIKLNVRPPDIWARIQSLARLSFRYPVLAKQSSRYPVLAKQSFRYHSDIPYWPSSHPDIPYWPSSHQDIRVLNR